MSVLATKWLFLNAILLFNVIIQENSAQYIPPAASVEPLYPKGLRMSIPGEWDSLFLMSIYMYICLVPVSLCNFSVLLFF